MTTVTLRDYGYFDRAWDLTVETGDLRPSSGLCHGHVRRTEHVPYALYALDDRLWFQAGEHRWDTALITLRLTKTHGTGSLDITAPSRVPHRIVYTLPPKVAFDPTYDYIDEAEDDFFFWLTEQLSTPQDRQTMLAHYSAGFSPPSQP